MSIKSEPALTGGCQCGNVTYSSSSPPSSFTNCHCQTCRKLSGAPFLTFGAFPSSAITWTSGEESLRKTTFSEIAERTHCAGCGSPISMQYAYPRIHFSSFECLTNCGTFKVLHLQMSRELQYIENTNSEIS